MTSKWNFQRVIERGLYERIPIGFGEPRQSYVSTN